MSLADVVFLEKTGFTPAEAILEWTARASELKLYSLFSYSESEPRGFVEAIELLANSGRIRIGPEDPLDFIGSIRHNFQEWRAGYPTRAKVLRELNEIVNETENHLSLDFRQQRRDMFTRLKQPPVRDYVARITTKGFGKAFNI